MVVAIIWERQSARLTVKPGKAPSFGSRIPSPSKSSKALPTKEPFGSLKPASISIPISGSKDIQSEVLVLGSISESSEDYVETYLIIAF